MNISKILILLALALFAGHNSLSAQEDIDPLRMVAGKYGKHEYYFKGKALFNLPEKFIIDRHSMGSSVEPKEVLKSNRFTNYTGLQFAFVHPKYAGLKNDGRTVKVLIVRNRNLIGKMKKSKFVSASVKLNATAKWTARGWTYNFKLHNDFKNKFAVRPNFGPALVRDFEMRVTVNFDSTNDVIKSARIRHKWKLSDPRSPDKIIKDAQDQLKKVADAKKKNEDAARKEETRRRGLSSKEKVKLRKLDKKNAKNASEAQAQAIRNRSYGDSFEEEITYTFDLKYKGFIKHVENRNKGKMVLDPIHAKAIDLGVKHLMTRIEDPTWDKPDQNYTVIGELALAFFAVLRAGVEPTDKKLEKHLLRFVKAAKAKGYKKGKAAPSRSGYAAGCILMMCEAALNPNNTDKPLRNGGNTDVTASRNYRGSEILKTELLEMAKHCVFIYQANVKMSGKYGTTPSSTKRGHLWGYNCERGKKGGPHYSPAQYAVLGLRCAKLIGVPVHPNVWEDIHKGTLKDFFIFNKAASAQIKGSGPFLEALKGSMLSIQVGSGPLNSGDYKATKTRAAGAWGYSGTGNNTPNGSHGFANFNMVCAALGNLAMAYSFDQGNVQKDKDILKDTKKQMAAGLHYCQLVLTHFYKHLSFYDYYSWERVAVFYGIKTINGKNWHKIMADRIVAAQDPITGAWKAKGGHDHSSKTPSMATSYAVLFLKKATKELDYGIVTR